MPRTPNPLPDLLPEVFSAAEAQALGIRHDRLRLQDVLWLAPGLYARLDPGNGRPGAGCDGAGRDGAHPAERWREDQRLRAGLLAVKLDAGQFFSHHSAAALWGLPVPPRKARTSESRAREPRFSEARVADNRASAFRTREELSHTGHRLYDDALDVGYLQPERGSRGRGIRPHRFTRDTLHVVTLDGVPVLNAASTWVVLAGELGRASAVALGDAVIHTPRVHGNGNPPPKPLATLDEIERIVARPYCRNRKLIEHYVGLLSPRADSPPESHLRLLLNDWGLPTPELNYEVRGQGGQFLGYSEFAFPEYRLALEYEGDHHRTELRQWERDIEKYRDYANAGWEVLRVTRGLLYREPDTLRGLIIAAMHRRSATISL